MTSNKGENQTNNVISYWRNSLADTARVNVHKRKTEEAEEFSLEQIKAGQIPAAKATQIVEKYLAENEKKADESLPVAQVLICPAFAARRREHAQVNGDLFFTPVWITAELHKTGELFPTENPFVWIPRDYLEPTDDSRTVIGTIDAVDEFLEKHPFPVNAEDGEQPLRWLDVWQYADELLRHVSGTGIEDFSFDGFSTNNGAKMLPAKDVKNDGIVKHIVNLYDYLQKNEKYSPLMSRFAALTENSLSPLLSENEDFEIASRHYGQMSGGFSLSDSQREALHHFLTIKNGDILAVNGPPGTGKTTLLQSVVATMWIEAALKVDNEPPVIVAASTNNQAVTNIIESFAAAPAADNSILQQRWLPHIESYGLYCPSAAKIENGEAAEFQVTFADKTYPDNGLYLPEKHRERINIEDEDFFHEAEKYFLAQHEKETKITNIGVENVVELLHNRLFEVVAAINKGLSARREQDKLIERLKQNFGSLEKLNEKVVALETRRKELANEFEKARANKNEWLNFNQSISWTLKTFAFLPFVKRRLAFRHQSFFAQRDLVIETDLTDETKILTFLESGAKVITAQIERLSDELEILREFRRNLEIAAQNWRAWQNANEIYVEPSELADEIDKKLRSKAFNLAARYWEGRWLLEIKKEIADDKRETKSAAKQEKRWRRYAKITPCFVSTFHSLPKFFAAWEGEDKPLLEFIDLLIVDEAGQVSPEVAGASFALAKKALIVGDTLQIEPVWSLTQPIDVGNLKKHRLIESSEDADSVHELGVTATRGNVMKIAQRASKYQKFADFERGMFLAEHRRCVPEIINYCNELAYNGRLIPKRESEPNFQLPRMGYAHIWAQSRKTDGSRENRTEAEVVAGWLAENKDFLTGIYKNSSLGEIVGIITPFRRQANLIREKLRESGISEKITVGSVHSLQGAERPVIIFSSVHGTKDNSYFFERGGQPNMLNVAVSRAKDSFLVFGNGGIFNSSAARKPAKLLAKYLFADERNELTNIPSTIREELKIAKNVFHLTTLEAHRQNLREAFLKAEREIVIVSPFISEDAVLRDDLPRKIKTAVSKGVAVTIYTDRQLNSDNRGNVKSRYSNGKKLLLDGGAVVKEVKAEHSKTLIIDRRVLIEGSFNWLSASRDENSLYQRRERSIKYIGEEVAPEIQRLLDETESRVAAKIK